MIRRSTLETLERITASIERQTPGAYLRFGDGDCFGAQGLGESFHDPDPVLAKELSEAFNIVDPRVLMAFPHHTSTEGFEPDMGPGVFVFDNFKVLWSAATRIAPSLADQEIYSAIALHYHLNHRKDLVVRLFSTIRKLEVVLLTSCREETGTFQNLFGDRVRIVYCSERNCYREIDRLERDIRDQLSTNRFKVVVLAAGLASRVLVKRLYATSNAYFFDIGSAMDCFYKNKDKITSRTWIRVTDAVGNAASVESAILGRSL